MSEVESLRRALFDIKSIVMGFTAVGLDGLSAPARRRQMERVVRIGDIVGQVLAAPSTKGEE